MNCTEQLLAYSRARMEREELKRIVFGLIVGAILGTLFALGMK